MFGIDWQELLVIVIVAVLVIGPKDLPLAMRTAGRWIAKIRRVSGHFRSGLDTMIREAEMEEMEKKWAEQNKKIMAEHPADAPPEMEPTGAYPAKAAVRAEERAQQHRSPETLSEPPQPAEEPELPLGGRGGAGS
jgi:sec-independent protein translocase protein TatB